MFGQFAIDLPNLMRLVLPNTSYLVPAQSADFYLTWYGINSRRKKSDIISITTFRSAFSFALCVTTILSTPLQLTFNLVIADLSGLTGTGSEIGP